MHRVSKELEIHIRRKQTSEFICSPLHRKYLSWNYYTTRDSPTLWEDSPLGITNAETHLMESYYNPLDSSSDSIAFNSWLPQITELRKARLIIEEGIQSTITVLITPEARKYIDFLGETNETYHYFYSHCEYFRFIYANLPIISQGFFCTCNHYEQDTDTFPPPIQEPHTTLNPLITPEEDAFFYHSSLVFEGNGHFEAANAMRKLRKTVPFMFLEIAHLFEGGYLTSLKHIDAAGVKYPVIQDIYSQL